MESRDVVVVGAGLAGLQCARLLGREGLDVLLVDRKPRLTGPVHTTGIFVRRTLEDFDLPLSCLGPPVRRVTLHSPAGRAIALASERDEFRVGRMASIYDHYARDAKSAGVTVRAGAALESIEPDGDGPTLAFGRSRARVRCRFVVGADGSRSRVAASLGLARNTEMLVGMEDVFHWRAEEREPSFHCLLDPRLAPGYVAWIADDGIELHVGVAGSPGRFDPATALECAKTWAFTILDSRNVVKVERRGGLIPVGGVLERIACARGLLVGDAAGAASPLTAGGLDAAMRLSACAARAVSSALLRGDRNALDAYRGDRFRSRFVARLWMRRLYKTLATPRLVDLAFAILHSAPGRLFARHVFFGRGSFPDVDFDIPATRIVGQVSQ